MKPLNQMTLSFKSLSVNESFARAAAAAFFLQLDPTVEEIADIKTAVSEAVTNCIVHAYPNAPGTVRLTAAIYPGRKVTVRVKDTGLGIEDVKKAMEPLYTTGAPDERAGLGFCVMQSFMDRVSVRSKPGKGTCVTLTKFLKDGAKP